MTYIIRPFTWREWLLWGLICGVFAAYMFYIAYTAAVEQAHHVMEAFTYVP